MNGVHEISSDRAEGFVRELDALRARVQSGLGAADLNHGRRISWVGRLLSVVGYGLCVLGVNPFSILLIGLGRFTRWVLIAHTVLHRGYDKISGTAPAWHSKSFARGPRRWWDWFDWLQADDWQGQHNVDHHCYVGDERDPDRVAKNLEWMKARPKWFRAMVLLVLAATWKWTYYGPATRRATLRRSSRSVGQQEEVARAWSPRSLLDRELLVRSYLPYVLVHFVVLPCAFIPFGWKVVLGALVNSLLAELLVNLHAFAVVGPTHTGVDIPIFHGKARSREEFFVRQVLGSVNYHSTGPVSRFLQGYMGYQIEHHLYPDLPLRQYPLMQGEVEALCAKYGIPYRKHPVWKRIWEMIHAIVGDEPVPDPPRRQQAGWPAES
jgi:fatty acid desaturase